MTVTGKDRDRKGPWPQMTISGSDHFRLGHFRFNSLPITSGSHHFRFPSIPVTFISGYIHFRFRSVPVPISSGSDQFRFRSFPVPIIYLVTVISGSDRFRFRSFIWLQSFQVPTISGSDQFRFRPLPAPITSGSDHFGSDHFRLRSFRAFGLWRPFHTFICIIWSFRPQQINHLWTSRNCIKNALITLCVIALCEMIITLCVKCVTLCGYKMYYIMRKSYYVMHKFITLCEKVITLCGNYYIMRKILRYAASQSFTKGVPLLYPQCGTSILLGYKAETSTSCIPGNFILKANSATTSDTTTTTLIADHSNHASNVTAT